MMDFRDYVKKLRLEKKLTQIELAAASGVSKTHISRIETEKDSVPKPDTLKKLAPALGVTFEHLMYMAGYYNGTPEVELINKLDLGDSELLNRFDFSFDGEPVTDQEIKSMLAFLRMSRDMNK